MRLSCLSDVHGLSLNFLVCLKDSTVVAAIELDDKTHEKTSRVEADAKKEKALSAAGIKLARWNVSALLLLRSLDAER